MADALGIIGVIGVAGQIAQVAVQLGLDWKDAPADVKNFMTEVQSLKTVLAEVHANIITNDDFKNAFHGQNSTLLAQLGDMVEPTSTSIMVSTCKQELERLLDDLTHRAHGRRVGWERLKGAFLAKRTRETVENLQRQCGTLNSLVAVDALALGARTYKEIASAREEQKRWLDDWEAKKIFDWITNVDYSAQQSDLIKRRQEGTGQWLLNSTEYQRWVAATKQTLFCPGIPGAGKTILSSIIVKDLQARVRHDRRIGIAWVYCNFRQQAEQSAEDLLSSLLRQLSQNLVSFPECLRDLHNKHEGRTRPKLDELSGVLQAVAKLFSKVFIVVDALDECQLSNGSRAKFLAEILNLQSKTGANIIATSRFISDITDKFRESVSLEIRAQPDDVRRYMEDNIYQLPSFVGRNAGLKEEIMSKVIKAVDGMFLLAHLYLDSLKGARSPKAIRSSLDTLHTGSKAYDHAYDDVMKRIKGQIKGQKDLAMQVLSWITCAKRPLSTTELQHALSIEVGETELDPENIPEIEDILSVCAGLVTVDEESRIVRLVHYTTQEYFMRTLKRWFPDAQKDIMEVCATYLSFSVFQSGPCRTSGDFEGRLRSNPLYSYAAQYWGDHAREAGEAPRVVLDLLKNEMQLEAQVQTLMICANKWLTSDHFDFYPRQMQGLHVVAYFGMKEAARDLLKGNDRPDIKDSHGRTPLSRAAQNGHEGVVKMLLSTERVDINSTDNEGHTPLYWASRYWENATFKILIEEEKIDVNLTDDSGDTVLLWATRNGNTAAVKMLVDAGKVDVDVKDHWGLAALARASWLGNEDMVKVLVGSGKADVNLRDNDGLTPLTWAAVRGHKGVAEVLLGVEDVDVNSKDNDGLTPLAWTAKNGREAVAEVLLKAPNIDIAAEDAAGLTALQLSAIRCHGEVERLLLAYDAPVVTDFFGLQTMFEETESE